MSEDGGGDPQGEADDIFLLLAIRSDGWDGDVFANDSELLDTFG